MGKKLNISSHLSILYLLITSVVLRFLVIKYLDVSGQPVITLLLSVLVLAVGAFYVLNKTANVIEETTEVLSEKTKLAGGLLQSLGTAFPDMVIGVAAALISLHYWKTDYRLAISYAILASATTFGSNIYNISHSIWCVYRQNQANIQNKFLYMIPKIRMTGLLTPMKLHPKLPSLKEIDTSIDVLGYLSLLTAFVAVSMVIFGKVVDPPSNISGDLYQLIQPIGAIVLIICGLIIYHFRSSNRFGSPIPEIDQEEKYYRNRSSFVTWFHLGIAGISIFFAAESMVHAITSICAITGIPVIIAGVLTGLIGCLGEIIVVHRYSVNPKGRLGDALVGVGMDNIVTTLGAALVSLIGGIFLGGNALIVIFVLILLLNMLLVWQISKLKTSYFSLIKDTPTNY